MTTPTVNAPTNFTLTERHVCRSGRFAYDLIEAHHRGGARVACAYSDSRSGWLVCADVGIEELLGARAPELAVVRTREEARQWVNLLASLHAAAVGRTVNSELIVAPDADGQVPIRKCARGWQSTCSCGTDGRPRISKARARQDARDHAARTGHENRAAVR